MEIHVKTKLFMLPPSWEVTISFDEYEKKELEDEIQYLLPHLDTRVGAGLLYNLLKDIRFKTFYNQGDVIDARNAND